MKQRQGYYLSKRSEKKSFLCREKLQNVEIKDISFSSRDNKDVRTFDLVDKCLGLTEPHRPNLFFFQTLHFETQKDLNAIAWDQT